MGTIVFNRGTVRASVRGALGTAVAVPLMFSAMPAMAQSQQQQMDQLRQQIQQMQQRFDQLQAQQEEMAQSQQPPRTAERLSADDERAKETPQDGFNVGNTNVQLSGYFKFDAIYDFEDDNGTTLGPYDAIGTLDAKGTDSPGDGSLGATIKQTRLKINTTTSTDYGDVGGYIEMDLYGQPYDSSFGGGPSPRVRRAYLTYGNWLIGRDWSTFSDFNYGTMLNFYGPQGQLFERQSLIRYTVDVDDDTSLDIALESPEGDGVTSPNVGVDDTGDNKAPDIAMRLQSKAGPVSFQVAGIARYLTSDIDDGSEQGDEDSTVAWGLDAGATWALPTGTTLMATAAGGEGIGKYIYAPSGGTDAYVDDGGNLETIQRYAYIGTISQELTSTLTGNIVYGKAFSEDLDNVSFDTGGLHDESSTLAVNLLYTPVDPLTLGIEYNRAEYQRQNGVEADAQNVQFSTIYNF